jgi:hypothetical protein
LPEGNVIQFFFDEDGVSVNEYGVPGGAAAAHTWQRRPGGSYRA